MHPTRTFKALIGTGAMLSLLLGAAVYRAVLADCPNGWAERDLACFFLPTHTDISIHLLSYAFAGMILLGTYFGLAAWHRQWTRMHSLAGNLARLSTSAGELERLARRLGLKDKVHLLDCKALLCFCAGFISPRIYLSRGIVEKLASEELEALLLHEKHHLKNYDPLRILLGRLMVSALFFLPVLSDILQRYLIEEEIAADRSAIHHQGHNRGIAGVLGKLLPDESGTVAGVLVASAAGALEYRIDHLTGHTPQHMNFIPIPRLVTSLLITALIMATILVPLSASHP